MRCVSRTRATPAPPADMGTVSWWLQAQLALCQYFFPLQGFLTVGADLHFSKGLREVIEKYRSAPAVPAEPTVQTTAASTGPHQL